MLAYLEEFQKKVIQCYIVEKTKQWQGAREKGGSETQHRDTSKEAAMGQKETTAPTINKCKILGGFKGGLRGV